jgi:hypothetical protein
MDPQEWLCMFGTLTVSVVLVFFFINEPQESARKRNTSSTDEKPGHGSTHCHQLFHYLYLVIHISSVQAKQRRRQGAFEDEIQRQQGHRDGTAVEILDQEIYCKIVFHKSDNI